MYNNLNIQGRYAASYPNAHLIGLRVRVPSALASPPATSLGLSVHQKLQLNRLHNNMTALTFDSCEPSLPWYWHHFLQAHDMLEAMEGSDMEQVKRERKARQNWQMQTRTRYNATYQAQGLASQPWMDILASWTCAKEHQYSGRCESKENKDENVHTSHLPVKLDQSNLSWFVS